MIDKVHFKNCKALRDAVLPLSRFTLLVGPNGSGKSTALQALQLAATQGDMLSMRTVGTPEEAGVEVTMWFGPSSKIGWRKHFHRPEGKRVDYSPQDPQKFDFKELEKRLSQTRVFAFSPARLAKPVQLQPDFTIENWSGVGLAGFFDRLRDREPERFEALNTELARWLPEFSRILFDTPDPGQRAFLLRTRDGQHRIPAASLSDGTLLALAYLALCYWPRLPMVLCFEEPDHGIHPRLLRHIQDAMYRLCYPEKFGEKRDPVQVIATTHAPYMLDLYREHPEEVVIASKKDLDVQFERLSDRPDIGEILGDASLGEVWFSGILGGVPVSP